MRVEVCVCTYKRRELLKTLLPRLVRQAAPGVCLSLLIVDNDPDGTAKEIVSEFARCCSYPVRYCYEGAKNISMARNRVLREATGEYLAFIDDDEIPSENWVPRLLLEAKSSQSDVVFGPVVPLFDPAGSTEKTVLNCFQRPRHRTGTVTTKRDWRAGNVLIRRGAISESGQKFDENFGFSGGEDFLFFSNLAGLGMKMTWCDEALVEEWVPADRSRPEYLLRRAFGNGQTYLRLLGQQGKRGEQKLEVVKAVMFLAFFGLPLLAAARLWPTRLLRQQMRAAAYLGKIALLFGYRSDVYTASRAPKSATGAA